MTTLSDLVNQIDRALLVHYTRPIYDVPASSYSDSQTSITLSSVESLGVGAILDAGFELMYVTAWNESTKVATVIRGFLGTTAAGGGTTTLVRVNPRVPTVAMVDTMLDEVRSWDERIFRVEAEVLEFPSNTTSINVDLSTPPHRVLSARPRTTSTDDERKWVYLGLRRNEAVSQFPSTYSVHLDVPFGAATTIDALFACEIDAVAAVDPTADLETDIELSSGMLEVIKWGALARITAGKEIGRLDYTGFARPDLDQAVPATALLQASAQYQQLRNIAYEREARRLLARWPIRFHG